MLNLNTVNLNTPNYRTPTKAQPAFGTWVRFKLEPDTTEQDLEQLANWLAERLMPKRGLQTFGIKKADIVREKNRWEDYWKNMGYHAMNFEAKDEDTAQKFALEVKRVTKNKAITEVEQSRYETFDEDDDGDIT